MFRRWKNPVWGSNPGRAEGRVERKTKKKGPWGGGCRSAPQTITPISSLSNGASWFEIIIIHNVQNIYNDVTGTVGKAGPLSDVTQGGCGLQFLVHDVALQGLSAFCHSCFCLCWEGAVGFSVRVSVVFCRAARAPSAGKCQSVSIVACIQAPAHSPLT